MYDVVSSDKYRSGQGCCRAHGSVAPETGVINDLSELKNCLTDAKKLPPSAIEAKLDSLFASVGELSSLFSVLEDRLGAVCSDGPTAAKEKSGDQVCGGSSKFFYSLTKLGCFVGEIQDRVKRLTDRLEI